MSISRKDSIESTDEEKITKKETLNPLIIYNQNFTESKKIVLLRAVFEFFATFMFIFLIILCEKDISKFILGMWIILIVFGNFSGPHLNPAVSLGFYISKGKCSSEFFKFFFYVFAQFFGCFIGIGISYLATGKIDYIDVPNDKSLIQIFISEMFFTGTFFFVIIVVSHPQTTPSSKGYINATFIIAWFYVIVYAGSSISGAAFNPAVLISMNFTAFITKNHIDKNEIPKLASMISAQFTGVIIFAIIYKKIVLEYYLIGGDYGKEENLRNSKNVMVKNNLDLNEIVI